MGNNNSVLHPEETITELVLKNGMMMAVYGTRKEIIMRLQVAEWVDFEAHSILNSDSNRAVYTLRASEVLMVGVERSKPIDATGAIDITGYVKELD